jgi:hypothetical protein
MSSRKAVMEMWLLVGAGGCVLVPWIDGSCRQGSSFCQVQASHSKIGPCLEDLVSFSVAESGTGGTIIVVLPLLAWLDSGFYCSEAQLLLL